MHMEFKGMAFFCFLMVRFWVHICLAGAQSTQPWYQQALPPSPGNWMACSAEKETADGLSWWSVHECG